MRQLFVDPNEHGGNHQKQESKEEQAIWARTHMKNRTQWWWAPLSFCCCYNYVKYCDKKRQMYEHGKAWQKLQKEVEITYILKQLRVLKKLVKQLLDLNG